MRGGFHFKIKLRNLSKGRVKRPLTLKAKVMMAIQSYDDDVLTGSFGGSVEIV